MQVNSTGWIPPHFYKKKSICLKIVTFGCRPLVVPPDNFSIIYGCPELILVVPGERTPTILNAGCRPTLEMGRSTWTPKPVLCGLNLRSRSMWIRGGSIQHAASNHIRSKSRLEVAHVEAKWSTEIRIGSGSGAPCGTPHCSQGVKYYGKHWDVHWVSSPFVPYTLTGEDTEWTTSKWIKANSWLCDAYSMSPTEEHDQLLRPRSSWGHMCALTPIFFCPSPMKIHWSMWIQW